MEVERGRDGETGYRLPHLKSSPVIMIAVVAFAGIIDGLFRAVRTFSPASHAFCTVSKKESGETLWMAPMEAERARRGLPRHGPCDDLCVACHYCSGGVHMLAWSCPKHPRGDVWDPSGLLV